MQSTRGNMIDIHTHICPGIDDGSSSPEESVKALAKMAELGVTDVFMSPHYLPGHYENTSEVVIPIMEDLKERLHAEDVKINLHQAAEVFMSHNIVVEIVANQLAMADSQYVLVEMDMNNIPVNLNDILYQIVLAGFYPILAHPERYMGVQQNNSLIEDLIYRNVYMQVNSGSLLGMYGKQAHDTAWFMVENGYVHFMGSDYHCHGKTYTLIEAKNAIAEHVDEYTANLLTKINPAKILSGEKVDLHYLKLVDEYRKEHKKKTWKDKLKGLLWS